MADIAGSGYTSPYTSPTFKYNLSYSQIGRDGSSATYRVYIDVYMTSTSSSFGYSLAGYVDINGAVSYVSFKGTEKWTGTTVHSFQVDVTAPAGTGGGTLNAHFNAYRPGGEGNSGKIDVYGTVSLSTWNTAPYWSGGSCSVSPSGIIPENTSSLTVSWTAASDTEGNTRYYTVKRYVNGSYNATIASNTTATSLTDTISSGNQGYSYYYTVEVNDGSLWASSSLTSNTVTKNTLTAATLSSSGNIAYSSASLAFSYSGASNTNGNATFTYSLSCNKVAVYNPTSSPTSVTIYKTGTLPTGTYIKFDDIKAATSGSANYTGVFTFTLTTTNAYGTSKTSDKSISVNIQTNPTTVGTVSTSGTYTIGGSAYYIPNRKAITVSWTASTDPLGGSITYELYGKEGSGSFTILQPGISSNTVNVSLSAVSAATTYTFRVIAKTSYGTTVSGDSASITLHYYNSPTVKFNAITRNMNDMTVSGTITFNSSIPGLTVTSLSYSGKTSGSLTATTTFSKQETGLAETDSYTFTLTVQNSGGVGIGLSPIESQISIPRYTPTLSVREKGVGVNALADDTYIFAVGGKSKFNDDIVSKGFFNNIKWTTNTSSSYSNQWTKIASLKVGSQYADSYLRIQLVNSADGNSYSESMSLYARIKQQTAMGTTPYVDINVFNNRNLPASNIKGVLIENSASLTQLDIYIKNPALYRAYAIYPMDKYGTVEIYESQGYVSTLPLGTQYSCNSGIYEEGSLLSDKYLAKNGGTISGNLAITGIGEATQLKIFNETRQTSADRPVSSDVLGRIEYMLATSSMVTNKPPLGDGHILTFNWDNTGGYNTQLALKNTSGEMSVRGMSAGVWSKWKNIPLSTSENIAYYVRTDGNDANTGLANTSGGAFKTISKALSLIPSIVNHDITISVAAGTYNEYIDLQGKIGSGSIQIIGAVSSGTPTVYVNGYKTLDWSGQYSIWLSNGTCDVTGIFKDLGIPIKVYGLYFNPTPQARYNITVKVWNCPNILFQSCFFGSYEPAMTGCKGISLGWNTSAYIYVCAFVNPPFYAIQCEFQAVAFLNSCWGSCKSIATVSSNGMILNYANNISYSASKYNVSAGGWNYDWS